MGNSYTKKYTPPAGVERDDRSTHLLAVGANTLTTALLQTFAVEDILDGCGVLWITTDNSARDLLDFIPGEMVNNVVFFAPGDFIHRPIAWNLLKNRLPDERFKVAEMVTNAFGSIYKDFWGPQSAFLLRTAIHANLDLGNTSLLGCLAMFNSDKYRAIARKQIKDPVVRAWWEEFERWPDHQKRSAVAPLQNKLGALLTNMPVRNMLGQARNKLEIAEALRGKIVVVEVQQKNLGGAEIVRLFGSLILYELMQSGFNHPFQNKPGCFVYINNGHAFSPDVLQELLGLSNAPFSIAMATSHLDRLNQGLQRTLMASCEAIIASRSSYADAERFHEHFGSLKMKEREFVGLAEGELAVKLSYGEPYWSSFNSLPHDLFHPYGKARSIINRSLNQHGTKRNKVEREIRAWSKKWLHGNT